MYLIMDLIMDKGIRRIAIRGVGVFILGILLFIGLLSIHIVDPNEVAVATRFGNLLGQRDSGLNFEVFAKYEIYNTRLQTHETVQSAATKDLQDINVHITVSYKIDEGSVSKIYEEVGTMHQINTKVLNPVVAQTVKSIATQYGGEELIQKRDEVSELIKKELSEVLLKEYHLEVLEISLTNLSFTNEQFNRAIDDKQIAEQETLKAEFELEKSRIDAKKQAVLQETLTDQLLTKQWLEKWDGKLPTTLYLSGEESNFVFPIK